MEEHKKPIFLSDLGMQYPNENSKRKYRYGLYKCGYCGKEFKGNTPDIKRGKHKSCGCLNGEKHGLYTNRFYPTWNNMCRRCNNNSNNPDYKNYGGRGITICEEWLDVKNFIEWAEATHIEGMTLDRIDVDGNYEPSNCRWVDNFTQAINKRISIKNTSGFMGVHLNVRTDNWVARITVDSERVVLGTFKTIEEAVEARDNYIISNNLPHKLSSEYKQNE